MYNLFHRKPAYTLGDIAAQIGALNELYKQREKSLQLATVNRSDVAQQKYLEEVEQAHQAIDVCYEVLRFMCEEVIRYERN